MPVKLAECHRCGREFKPSRKGHIWCSRECRYASEDQPVDRPDPAAVERLFDPHRDPNEPVREDDWYPAKPVDCDDDSWNTLRELDMV